MSRERIIIFVTFVIMMTISPVTVIGEKLVIGYYPHWLKDDLPPEEIDLKNLTHIIHAFAWPNSDGTLSTYNGMIDGNLNYQVHLSGKQILISLGGWGNSTAFSDVTGNSSLRSTFIANIISFIQQNDYDGVDIDWEYPSTLVHKENLTLFVSELRSALDMIDSGYLLTMAISSGNWYGQWFDYEKLVSICDWLGVMTYDFHGTWSSHAGHNSPISSPSNCSDGSVETALSYLRDQRYIPSNQLVLGIPFYGKVFNAPLLYESFTGVVTDLEYNEIPSLINAGWSRLWDDYSKVPYLLNNDATKLITYDDSISVALKAERAIQENLSGVMIWAIGQDLNNGRQPLLEAVGNSMRAVSIINDISSPNTMRLYNSHPNPFNSSTTVQFRIPQNSHLTLDILDINGQIVEKLFSGNLEKGSHSVTWNPPHISSGLYFMVLQSNKQVMTNKLLYIK
ncbi:MAG TPA: T9SS type A sorting domain-containing protein [Candidatus Marinimicrobia bacterium]|nr:T9SS type A sorting domain-containing protein [Candidatus Neomarinimicrobiota bacterium]